MTRLAWVVVLLAGLGAGCGERPSYPDVDMPVNDKPLTDHERLWASHVIRSSDSAIVTGRVVVREWDEVLEYMHNVGYDEFSYRARWGEITGNHPGTYCPVLAVSIDGVDNVVEPGRWWRLVRSTLNRLAAANRVRDRENRIVDSLRISRLKHRNDSLSAIQDSARLFKLDSVMREMGR